MKTIIMIVALAASFMPGKKEVKFNSGTSKLTISYYWFDTSGNYLRQNILDDEVWITAYNNVPDNPKTLMEFGYNPSNCIPGSPPIPNNPSSPDQRLYSHP